MGLRIGRQPKSDSLDLGMVKIKEIDPNLKPEELIRQAYIRSVRMLGTREHSSTEIRNKLGDRGFNEDTISTVLQQLIESGYQSDERFATLYSEQLLRKHQGPLAISSKLSQRGIDSSLSKEAISSALVESGLNWAEVASEALTSRFSAAELALLSDSARPNTTLLDEQSAEEKQAMYEQVQQRKAKYARFLNRRGFSTTDSIKAIRLVSETVS